MALPVSFVTQGFMDNNKEVSHVRVPVTTLTAANLVAVSLLIANYLGASAGLTLGNTNGVRTQLAATIGAGVPAASPLSQRENKWLVRYHDSTNNQKFSVEVPCADLTLLPGTNTEFLDVTAGAAAAYKTAFEAVVVSPNDASHTVVLDSIQFVGRRA